MTLPASGAISMSQVNTELGRSSTAALSLNDIEVRRMARKLSGAVAMSDLRGRAKTLHMEAGGLFGQWAGYDITDGAINGAYSGVTITAVFANYAINKNVVQLTGDWRGGLPFTQVKVSGSVFVSDTDTVLYDSGSNSTSIEHVGALAMTIGNDYFIEFI